MNRQQRSELWFQDGTGGICCSWPEDLCFLAVYYPQEEGRFDPSNNNANLGIRAEIALGYRNNIATGSGAIEKALACELVFPSGVSDKLTLFHAPS
jgi:hypothetical protein